MRKCFPIIILNLLVWTLPTFAAETQDELASPYSGPADTIVRGGFRWAEWGAGKEVVKRTESGDLVKETKNSLVYEVYWYGTVRITYEFDDDKLFRGTCLSIDEYPAGNFAYHFAMAMRLQKKYGPPTGGYNHDAQDFNDVMRGKASSVHHWALADSEIQLNLHGGQNKIRTQLSYKSKELAKLHAKKNSRRNWDAL